MPTAKETQDAINAAAKASGSGGALKGAAAGAAMGSVFGPWGASVGAGLGAVMGVANDIKGRAKLVHELLNQINPNAAQTFWKNLSTYQLIKKMAKDWTVCAWNDSTGTCGERTTTYLVNLIPSNADPYKITQAAITSLLYNAFGNKYRAKKWGGILTGKMKKAGLNDLTTLAALAGAEPQTVAAWLAVWKAGKKKPPKLGKGGAGDIGSANWYIWRAAKALAGKKSWPPSMGKVKGEAWLRYKGLWPMTVALAKAHGYVPSAEDNQSALVAVEKWQKGVDTVTTPAQKIFFKKVSVEAKKRGIKPSQVIAELAEKEKAADELTEEETTAESDLKNVTLAALAAIVAAVVLGSAA